MSPMNRQLAIRNPKSGGRIPLSVVRRGTHAARLALCVMALLALSACHRTAPAPREQQPAESPSSSPEPPTSVTDASTQAAGTQAPAAPRARIPDEVVDADRWLYVLKAREGERGAWATGSFDAERNKLEISTNGAVAFAVDLSRIPINWEKLVIIGIDGVNSELRKRDYDILEFGLDAQKQWVVVEK